MRAMTASRCASLPMDESANAAAAAAAAAAVVVVVVVDDRDGDVMGDDDDDAVIDAVLDVHDVVDDVNADDDPADGVASRGARSARGSGPATVSASEWARSHRSQSSAARWRRATSSMAGGDGGASSIEAVRVRTAADMEAAKREREKERGGKQWERGNCRTTRVLRCCSSRTIFNSAIVSVTGVINSVIVSVTGVINSAIVSVTGVINSAIVSVTGVIISAIVSVTGVSLVSTSTTNNNNIIIIIMSLPSFMSSSSSLSSSVGVDIDLSWCCRVWAVKNDN
jgi:hypothetical protein